MKKLKRSTILFILIGIVFVWGNAHFAYKRIPVENIRGLIGSDGLGYYQYLPSLTIEDAVCYQQFSVHLDNGMCLNKYTYGVAFLESPFFHIGRVLTNMMDAPIDKGRGPYYMLMMAVSSAFYLYLSLVVLFVIVRKKFDLRTAWYTVIVLYLGTNILYYVLIEPGMSHIYSLFCFSMCLYATDKFYETYKTRDLLIFSIFFGLATLTRPTNIVLVLLFFFYKSYNWMQLKEQFLFHIRKPKNLLILFIVCALFAIPQMVYWYMVTGKPVVFSYGYNHESFSNATSPKIFQVLFHYKSGWLFYTPIMVLSLVGLFISIRKKILSGPVILIIFLLTLYICASWWAPTFGCAFGYRSFIEYYGILVLPFALVVSKLLNHKKKIVSILFVLISAFLVYTNMKVTQRYVTSGGCWDGPDFTWEKMVEMWNGVFTTLLW